MLVFVVTADFGVRFDIFGFEIGPWVAAGTRGDGNTMDGLT
jgi:hypothetical protein